MHNFNRIMVPLLVWLGAFVTIYVLGHAPAFQSWLQGLGLGEQLNKLQLELNAIMSTALAAMITVIKEWTKPKDEQQSKRPSEETREDLERQKSPDAPEIDWQAEYHKLYRRASRIVDTREKQLDGLKKDLQETRDREDEYLEQRGILRFTLLCGLFLAFGSFVGTILSGATSIGPTASPKHTVVVSLVFFSVAGLLTFFAMILRQRPRRVPFFAFGMAALYVNAVALIISLPYTVNRMWGNNIDIWGVALPIPIWIGLSRFAILPIAAIAGSIVGTALAFPLCAPETLQMLHRVDNRGQITRGGIVAPKNPVD